ncbi:hypothetical protein LSUE1_G007314 [Lachnellula suecica]|uniref:Maintenance of telomere capping protein 4 n=1 Tax=Lachnellula suecica TaxID=602035 RepID=A0A8T9CDQ7_9HELO|nr:hypothetical protein LSUE1_G007314 [Lachnellula suecica]
MADTGSPESSSAASKRSSSSFANDSLDVPKPSKTRSHRTRHSGGFLLAPEERDLKGKGHAKRHSNYSVGGSPLAAHVLTTRQDMGGDSTAEKEKDKGKDELDVDSAKIVNLALNLSESRRNAARRNISTPLPPAFGEGFAGGSLRQHLQQQRRVSRNVSPKPDRGERAVTASPRAAPGQKIQSPLQASFESAPEGGYQYHFSASTLARAEKAKNVIELMAQYRRLLQYVPPLKPQLERGTSDAGTAPVSPTSSAPTSRAVSEAGPAPRSLGREYNPLQYIRNRKVRSRNAKAIDGEVQGFGDLEKVSAWVDQVTKESSSDDCQAADCLIMPSFSRAADIAASPNSSPQASSGKSHAAPPKVKRPRIDWVTNPADMIADVFWLEQDDNKKIIEDRHGRRVFPKSTELRRPMSRRSEEPELLQTPGHNIKKEASAPDLRIDTQLPTFRSIKDDSEKHSDSATSRAKQKLRGVRDATRIHHGHNGSAHDRRQFMPSLSRSDSDSSESDAPRRLRRSRSGTAESSDRRTDILAKQMEEMLAQEAKEMGWSRIKEAPARRPVEAAESPKVSKNGQGRNKLISPTHSRSGSVVNTQDRSRRESLRTAAGSGRASLEVPGHRSRPSLEELDSTAPNSPETKASKLANAFIPSIAMDLSSPRGRHNSPTRTPLSRVKSKIRPAFRDHSHERSQSHVRIAETPTYGPQIASKEHTPESPDTADKRNRSISPVKKIISRRTDESTKAQRMTGSLRKGKTEESGIRGLFKGTRNPVSRVSDFLWKTKEPSAGHGTSSGFSTDESDVEDIKTVPIKIERTSRDSSAGFEEDDIDAILPGQEKPSYLKDMPTFTSPFEPRGRPTRTRSDQVKSDKDFEAREERRKASRATLLDPTPRIDVHNASPTSSPDTGLGHRFTRDSSVSDLESRRDSFAPGVQGADARLNAILGIPGKRRNALPITGLSNLETTHESPRQRQWSISDRGVSLHRGPMTKREIARIRALLLSSGIKAKEISRRAAEPKDLSDDAIYADVAALAPDAINPVPKSQEHILAARILSNDIQLSSRMWQSTADTFVNDTMSTLLSNLEGLCANLADNLAPSVRKAADEADEVSKDLVTNQTLQVKRVTDTIEKMTRRRRRRFRWLRRGGWVMVEWALVGVMWYVWFMVVLARVVMGAWEGCGEQFALVALVVGWLDLFVVEGKVCLFGL